MMASSIKQHRMFHGAWIILLLLLVLILLIHSLAIIRCNGVQYEYRKMPKSAELNFIVQGRTREGG